MRLALTAVVFLVAGCSQVARQPSALQRLQGGAPLLRAASASATRVSYDWSRLAASVSGGNVPQVQRQVGVLLVDSNRLSARSGRARAYLRSLRSEHIPTSVKQYLTDLARGLSAQWWEAREAARTARLVQRDPELREGEDAAILSHLATTARRSAIRATRWVEAARTLRRRDARQFRYLPVAVKTKEGTP